MNLSDEQIKAWILKKLDRHGRWSAGKATDINNIPKGQEKRLKKLILKLTNELYNDNYLSGKKGLRGIRYYLNLKKKVEIHESIRKYYKR